MTKMPESSRMFTRVCCSYTSFDLHITSVDHFVVEHIEDLKRKQVKEFLREWEQRSPGCTDSIFAALSNVAPPLLLDRRLFDFVGLCASDQSEGHEDVWLDHENNT